MRVRGWGMVGWLGAEWGEREDGVWGGEGGRGALKITWYIYIIVLLGMLKFWFMEKQSENRWFHTSWSWWLLFYNFFFWWGWRIFLLLVGWGEVDGSEAKYFMWKGIDLFLASFEFCRISEVLESARGFPCCMKKGYLWCSLWGYASSVGYCICGVWNGCLARTFFNVVNFTKSS